MGIVASPINSTVSSTVSPSLVLSEVVLNDTFTTAKERAHSIPLYSGIDIQVLGRIKMSVQEETLIWKSA